MPGAASERTMTQNADRADRLQPSADRAPADRAPPESAPEEPVPRLPRGRGLRLSRPQLVRIAGTVVVLVFVIVMQRPCATAVSKFVTSFDDRGSAAAVLPRPGTVDLPAGSAAGSGSAGSAALDLDSYERLRPGMTDAEIKAAIERARLKAAGSGSGAAR